LDVGRFGFCVSQRCMDVLRQRNVMATPHSYAINNTLPISADDMRKALGLPAMGGSIAASDSYKGIGFQERNPCREIIDGCEIAGGSISAAKLAVGAITAEKLQIGEIRVAGKTTLSEWRSGVTSTQFSKDYVQGNYADSVDIDFDEAVWRIYVPGVPKEDIKLFTVDNLVYVDFKDDLAKRKIFKLDEDENVKSSKLELGVLTVVIDRPNKRQFLEIG
jgi:HSP20 family molecular chaperone IbpA